jgi:acetyltransferase-like isoleucine patch superfamily enzyme
MLGKIITIIVHLTLYLRFLFWKMVLEINGGGIGKNAKIYESVKLFSRRGFPIRIGDNISIEKGVVMSTSEGGKIHIGNNVYIGEYSILTSNEEIEIGDNVLISPHNVIVDFNHIYEDIGQPVNKQGVIARKITIQEGVWIGSGSKILIGVTVGKGAVVGAGSVVTKDVPAFHVVVGNPAKIIKRRSKLSSSPIPSGKDRHEGASRE